jgi:hypothetical protein
MILYALRGGALGIGVALFYVAFLTYPSEARQMKSRLEDLWLRLAYREGPESTKSVRFLRVVAKAGDHVLNRIFGPRLISAQVVAVSICYEFAVVNLSGAVLVTALRLPTTGLTTGTVVGSVILLALGSAGALWRPLRVLTYATAALVASSATVAIPAFIVAMQRGHAVGPQGLRDLLQRQDPFVVAVNAVSWILYGVAIVYLTRRIVRASTKLDSSVGILALLSLTLVLTIVPFALSAGALWLIRLAQSADPVVAMGALRPLVVFTIEHQEFFLAALVLIGGNVLWSLIVLPVLVVAATLGAHFVLWPFIQNMRLRMLHSTLHWDLLENRRVLGALAGLFLLVALGASTSEIRSGLVKLLSSG